MQPDARPRCVKCNGIVDAKGVSSNGSDYCDCVCQWPLGGCRARIFFQVNPNEKVQPFTLSTGRAHHGECPPFDEWKRQQRAAEREARRVAASTPPPKDPGVTLERFL